MYFSDNGSTAIEIALKMAFRKFSFDHGIHDAQESNVEAQRTELMVSWWYKSMIEFMNNLCITHLDQKSTKSSL